MRRVPTVRLATALVLLLLATACGARLSDSQLAALRSGAGTQGAGATGPGVAAGGPASGGPTAGTPGASGGTASAGPGAAKGQQQASGGGGGGGGGGAAAEEFTGDNGGATDVGITADTIKVGNISQLSGPMPGFGETGARAVQAYFSMLNSQGGIYGRQVEVSFVDDRFDAGVNRAETARLKDDVFAFVGGTSVVDSGGATVLKDTNIPDFSLALDDVRIALPNNFSPNPLDLNDGGNNSVRLFKYFKEKLGARTAAVIWPSSAIPRNRAQGYLKDFERAGLDVVYTAEVAVSETNYTPHAAQMKEKGADVVVTTLEVNGISRLAKALQQQGYRPKVPMWGAQVYGWQFLQLAGEAAEGTIIAVYYSIFEDRASNPAVDAFLTWMDRVNPGLQPDFFAIEGWLAADMFAQAAEAAGPKLTRDGIIAAMKGITDFSGHGFTSPMNPGAKQNGTCFLVAKVENGAWVRVDPADRGFICE